MTPTAIDLEGLRALLEKATPGPWAPCHHLKSPKDDASCPCGYRGGVWGNDGEVVVFEMGSTADQDGDYLLPVADRATQLADAALIVAAVNALPTLLAELTALRSAAQPAAERWQPIETAPKDGTWILGINNRGNQAVIIWSDRAHDLGRLVPGWIHPFSDMGRSPFWNGACGSVATHWMPLPAPPAAAAERGEG